MDNDLQAAEEENRESEISEEELQEPENEELPVNSEISEEIEQPSEENAEEQEVPDESKIASAETSEKILQPSEEISEEKEFLGESELSEGKSELELTVDEDDVLKRLIAEAEEALASTSENMSSTNDLLMADQSSGPSEEGPSAGKEKRLSKLKPLAVESDESVRSLTLEEAVVPDLGPKTPPPMSPKETQTDWHNCGVEVINLPLLKEMKRVDSEKNEEIKKWNERVLGTGIMATFKGPMPTVVLPLDKFYPMESPRVTTMGRITPRGSTLEVVSTFTTRTANNVVDAQVTYRDKGGIRVDIDGGGLQVMLDVTQKKKKRKKSRWERRVKREPFSLRPPKPKPNRCPDLRRKLAWLEDKAEDTHICRMQTGRTERHWKPSLAKIEPPDFGPRWREWDVLPYAGESPTKNVGRTYTSTTQHLGLMMYARAMEAEKKRPRQLAAQPTNIPAATKLSPSANAASVYEDERTRRLREAREHYAELSVRQAAQAKGRPTEVEAILEEGGGIEEDSDNLDELLISSDDEQDILEIEPEIGFGEEVADDVEEVKVEEEKYEVGSEGSEEVEEEKEEVRPEEEIVEVKVEENEEVKKEPVEEEEETAE